MMGPAVGVGLHSHRDPRMVYPVSQTKGNKEAMLGPVFFAADRQGEGGKQVAAIKADLAFLHFDGGVWHHTLTEASGTTADIRSNMA